MVADGRLYQLMATSAVNVAAIGIGQIFTWTSPVFPKLSNENWSETSPLPYIVTRTQQSWIGSLVNIGAIFGPIFAWLLVDRIGRKKVLLTCAIPLLIGWALLATTKSVTQIYIARIISGLSIGAVFSTLPLYVAEISQKSSRGTMGTFLNFFLTMGYLVSFSIGPYTSYTLFNTISAAVPILFVLVYLPMPETPYYYAKKDKIEEATQSLMKLRGKSSPEEVQLELYEIKSYLEANTAKEGKFADLFTVPEIRTCLIFTLGLLVFQQLSCMNAVLQYTQDIFYAANATFPAEVNTIIIGVVKLSAGCVAPIFVDRLGRKILLQISGYGMAVGLLFLGLYFYMDRNNLDTSAVQYLPIISLIIYVTSFCLGFGSVPWLVISEVFPSNIKSLASTVLASTCWATNFFITKFFPLIMDEFGMDYAFWLFAVFCFAGALFVLFLLPETKGKSLNEIQEFLKNNNNIPKCSNKEIA